MHIPRLGSTPNHFDGSQSLLDVGLATAGERDVVLWEENPMQHKDDRTHLYWPQGEPAPNLVFKQKPGSVYIGVLTGAAHQARRAPLEASPPEYYIGSEGEASHPKKLATRTRFPFAAIVLHSFQNCFC